jgi:hypothetical protein
MFFILNVRLLWVKAPWPKSGQKCEKMLHSLHYTPNVIGMAKPMMWWEGTGTSIEEMRKAYKIVIRKPNGKHYLCTATPEMRPEAHVGRHMKHPSRYDVKLSWRWRLASSKQSLAACFLLGSLIDSEDENSIYIKNSVALARKRTLPKERPPLVAEVSANFCG